MTTKPKTVVIYHKADFDGLFCREIARKFLGDNATYIGWDYGDPTPAKAEIDGTEQLYMLDISVPDLMDHPRLIWIDHHKSAIEKYQRKRGYQIDGVAACRLSWQWFTFWAKGLDPHFNQFDPDLPTKQDYIDRKVDEPFAVRLAGEYDIWDKRDERAELFQHGLRSQELTDEVWAQLLDEKATIGFASKVQELLMQGRAVQYAKRKEDESIIKAAGFMIQFEGLTFLACNHARCNSHLFTAGLKPEHDACFGFAYRDGQWVVSLYHAPGKEHHDLSLIAVKYGGGGHAGACGFRTAALPFLKS